jgi:hypothetical protein
MKRWSPIAYPGPGDTHRNFNQSTGERGSWLDADGYQQNVIDEPANLVELSGMTLDESDPEQTAKAVRSGKLNYRTAGGTANALTVMLDPVPAAFASTAGLVLRIETGATNTGATTLNIGVGGNVAIVDADTGGALKGGELPLIAVLISNGTVWRLLNRTADTTVRDALFPYFSILNSANFSSSVGVETGFTNWALPVGNAAIAAGFNTANSQFTVPAGMGGLWYFQAYANSLTSLSVPASGHGMRLRKNGTLIGAGSSPPSSIIQCVAMAMVPAAAGDVVQMLNLADNSGMALSYFFFTAVRLGRVS